MIFVVNKAKGSYPTAVYVGRGTPLGSPFHIGTHGNRGQVIAKYKTWLDRQGPDSAAGLELARLDARHQEDDLVLSCHCAPLACHADVIAKHVAAMSPEID